MCYSNANDVVFEMGERPNREWGSRREDRPGSVIEEQFVTNPYFVAESRSFYDSTAVVIRCYTPGADIRYTTNGATPSKTSTRYSGPVTLDQTSTLRAIAYKDGMHPSSVETVDYIRMPRRRTIVYDNPYHHSYTAGGDNGLLDGIRGDPSSFAEWQGFLGVDLGATVDLGEDRRVRRISTGFLQDYASWIFLPVSVEYSISTDGKDFISLGVITNTIPLDRGGSFVREFEKRVRHGKARYVRVVAKNIGINPTWHPGAGEKAFVFADEIVIE